MRAIFGRPRMGKTTLARYLVKDCPRVVFLDPFPVAGAIELWDYEDCAQVDWEAPKLRAAWHFDPDFDFLQTLDNVEIVIDDPTGEHWKGNQIRDIGLRKLVTRGGHYSQRLTFVTQRPSLLPLTVRSFLSEVYVFALTDRADIQSCQEQWGITVPRQPLEYQAWIAPGFEAPAGLPGIQPQNAKPSRRKK